MIIRRSLSSLPNGKTLVELFYDIASPYTYLQTALLKRQEEHWKSMHLRLTPVSIANIFKESSNSPPALVPTKGKYLLWDLNAQANYYKIPFRLPENFFELIFEVSTLKTQRFLVAIQKYSPNTDDHDKLVQLFYHRFFTPNNPVNITDIEILKKLSIEAGVSSNLVNKAANDITNDEIKTTLKENTKRAVELGGFGLPITLIHNKKPIFIYGSDRLHLVGHFLGEKEPPILKIN